MKLILLIAAIFSMPVFAQELIAIKVEPSDIAVHKPVEITMEFNQINDQGSCNVLVNFGDGKTEDVRIEAKKTAVKISHVYETVGNYPISADGKTKFRGFNTVFGCPGSNRSTAVVVREENYADKAAAAEEEKKAAYERAAAEAKAAKAEADKATKDRTAASAAAKKAAMEKDAAQKAAIAAASDRAAQERAAAKAKAAAEKAEKLAAERSAAAASEASRPVDPPRKVAPPPVKAGSATDL